MRNKIIFSFYFLCLSFVLCVSAYASDGSVIRQLEPFNRHDRILILAPHPDDETIGCAGIIQKARAAKARIKVVYLTNGDHNEFAFIVYEKRMTFRKGEFLYMGEVRKQESRRAMDFLGLKDKGLVFLGYPDFGTFTMFRRYWQQKRPFRTLLTRVQKVPYKDSPSFDASYSSENILEDLKRQVLSFRPNKIFVSHPADVNSDHKSFYLFLEVALADLRFFMRRPKVYPYLIHHSGWPLPRHYHPDLILTPPERFQNSSISWVQAGLNREETENKANATLCYRSQTASSAFYLLAFARENELFGDYPELDLRPKISESLPEISATSVINLFRGINDYYAGRSQRYKAQAEDKAQGVYSLKDGALLISIKKAGGLGINSSVRIYLFGYNYGTPFAYMPKVCIIAQGSNFKAFDKNKVIRPPGIILTRTRDEMLLKIPLEVLGEPDFVIAQIQGHAAVLPADVTGFRKILIR